MAAASSGNPESLVGRVEAFVWDSEAAVAYEAAVEAINAAVGAYSARIAALREQPVPDAAAIEELLAGRAACARAHEQLDPDDPVQVAETRRRFSALARSIGGR